MFRSSAEDFERAMQRRVAVMSSGTKDGRDADVKGLNLVSLCGAVLFKTAPSICGKYPFNRGKLETED